METGRKGGYRLSMMRVAIDTGGTFTDCVYLQDGKLVVLKVFSTPHDPGAAVLDGLRKIAASPELVVRHGTTVGTNAMLERRGAPSLAGRTPSLPAETRESSSPCPPAAPSS